ncbi:MAG: hypothetical protein U0996_11135 [Planctomycetaceae bacterium]
MDPVKIGFIILGAALTSLGFGTKFLRLAWVGFRDASYPLSETKQLRGTPARLAALLIGAFGLVTFTCGIAALVFGYWRMKQLFR